MWLIGIFCVIDWPLLVWFVVMIYNRSGLIFAIIFAISTLPQIAVAVAWVRWMFNDSAKTASSVAVWMLINLPVKFIHGIL